MFSSLNEIRGNGSLLLNVSPDPGITDQFVLFQNMKFNCPGYVKKVKFLSIPSNDTDNTKFGIGELIGGDNYKVKHWLAINVSESGTIVEHSYILGQMRYEAGDIFAVQQSHSKLLLYNMDRRIELYNCSNTSGQQMYRCIPEQGYQPLVTIETGKKTNKM